MRIAVFGAVNPDGLWRARLDLFLKGEVSGCAPDEALAPRRDI
jgi:hypothetical protein